MYGIACNRSRLKYVFRLPILGAIFDSLSHEIRAKRESDRSNWSWGEDGF